MKNLLICFIGVVVLCSACNSTGKQSKNMSTKKYISVVKNVDGYNVAYTEDGHILLYNNDSIGNYTVYYVKFENDAGKYGLKSIGAMIVRAEMDATLTKLNSFHTVQKGTFCIFDIFMGYKVFFFDEHLNWDSIENLSVPLDCTQVEEMVAEQEVKHISNLLKNAFFIAQSINSANHGGWEDMVYALRSTLDLPTYDIAVCTNIYDKRVLRRLPKLQSLIEKLRLFRRMLQKRMIIQNGNNIQNIPI